MNRLSNSDRSRVISCLANQSSPLPENLPPAANLTTLKPTIDQSPRHTLPSTAMSALKNKRHEAFAHAAFKALANGQSVVNIYRKLYPKVSQSAASAAASRLLKTVSARVSQLQASVTKRTLLTMQERRDFLARVVRADLKNFDMAKDGDLIEEITEEKGKSIRFKLPSKRACVMDDAKLAGELIEHQDLTTNGEALPTAMPSINLQMPPTFIGRRGIASEN